MAVGMVLCMSDTAKQHEKVGVGVVGGAGRMGLRLVALADSAGLHVAGAVEHVGHAALGQDIGVLAGVGDLGVPVVASLEQTQGVGVVIDFSSPQGLASTAAWCEETGSALVVGTTGLDATHDAVLQRAAERAAVCQATNFSLVVNVLWKLAGQAARLLGEDYDIEVLEVHHRHKKDAPSGTALTLVKTLCDATGRDFERNVVYARQGDAPGSGATSACRRFGTGITRASTRRSSRRKVNAWNSSM